MSTLKKLDRREFLKLTGMVGVGLLIGIDLSGCSTEETSSLTPTEVLEALPTPATPLSIVPTELNTFISISPDDVVTLICHRSEMGQGVRTSLPMIIAEELCAEWSTIKIKQAVADPKYGTQNTGGSTSVVNNFTRLRRAGAGVRMMLLEAAANRWNVDISVCNAENGAVINRASGERLRFGDLALEVAELDTPADSDIALKNPADFVIIGQPKGQVDENELVMGKTTFGLDVRVPGMLYATIARCPIIGGSLSTYDADAARAVEGVVKVVEIDYTEMLNQIGLSFSTVRRSGPVVAVVAKNTWAAIKGREALKVTWNEGEYSNFTSDGFWEELSAILKRTLNQIDEDSPKSPEAVGTIEAVYRSPYVAHVPMEPMNATVDMSGDQPSAWLPTQFPTAAMQLLPGVNINVTRMGGAFGRRATNDFTIEASLVSKTIDAPVQVVWTREDDIQFDVFRPGSLYLLKADLNASGLPVNLKKVAGGHRPGRLTPYNTDFSSQGYNLGKITNRGHHLDAPPVSVGAWRGPGSSDEAFALECFLDEMAQYGNWDPYELRRKLITSGDKLAVLDRVIGMSGWGGSLPEGWGRGLACYSYYTSEVPTEVAQVAEVSIESDGNIRVHKMYCAIHCGLAINPAGIVSQVESCIAMGLSVVLYDDITFRNGRVEQAGLHDYPFLSMDHMPLVEVSILESDHHPQGVGEPPIAPVAPAVLNAVYDVTGIRIRHLPVRSIDLV